MDSRRRIDRRGRGVALAGIALILASGCATQARNRQLESVARDWCMVIRASQVIPVYPLTADLLPGDLFLVQRTVDEQHEAYDAEGFLPLDNHLARMPLPGVPPDLATAPHAAFPTYAFSVRRGAGLSMALPVQGVPVALSLMGTGAADGSVALRDARTFGLDAITLHGAVEEWARAHQEFLSHYAPHEGKQNYLRVIGRVYVAGRVSVSLSAAQERGAALSGGVAPPLALLTPGPAPDPASASLERYEANLGALNAAIASALGGAAGGASALPGASVRLVSASARAVALEETFAQPLCFGYLGFDLAIGAHGVLGPPIPTHAVLTASIEPSPELERVTNSALRTAYAAWQERARLGDPQAPRVLSELDGLAALVPAAWPCDVMGQRAPGGPLLALFEQGAPITAEARDFATVTTYRSRLLASIDAIERALRERAGARVIERGSGRELAGAEAAADLEARLAGSRRALADFDGALDRHRALLRRAVSSAVAP
jgi:hypothetical protein